MSTIPRRLLLSAVLVVCLAVAPKLLFRVRYPVHSTGAVLISGTSSGIGRATCGWLATRYPQVTFYCGVRNEKDAVGFPFDQSNVQSVILDITNQTHIHSALEQITQLNQQPLIGVINNAGANNFALLEFIHEEQMRHILEVNFFGGFLLTQAALPHLRQSQGRILFVTSASGVMPGTPFIGAYQASKHATEAIADAWRLELAEQKVSVSIMEPGFLRSVMVESAATHVQKMLNSAEAERERALYPKLYDNYLQKLLGVSETMGHMEETCEAMEDALFSPYPKTRYQTSRLGPLPAWLFVKILEVTPDRMTDWMFAHLEIVLFVQGLRSSVERLFGYTSEEL